MYHLRYSEQAREDLVQIRRYLAKESGSREIARRFLTKLRQQCQQIAALPGMMGRARPEGGEGMRSLPYGNYVIFFRYNNDFVEIVSIIEGHRDIEELFRP